MTTTFAVRFHGHAVELTRYLGLLGAKYAGMTADHRVLFQIPQGNIEEAMSALRKGSCEWQVQPGS